jgi:hypothetical protein
MLDAFSDLTDLQNRKLRYKVWYGDVEAGLNPMDLMKWLMQKGGKWSEEQSSLRRDHSGEQESTSS